MNTVVCSVTSEPNQSGSRCVSSFKDSSVLQHLSGELNKSEVLLISSTLLVVNTENVYQNTSKIHITMETSLCIDIHTHIYTYIYVLYIYIYVLYICIYLLDSSSINNCSKTITKTNQSSYNRRHPIKSQTIAARQQI